MVKHEDHRATPVSKGASCRIKISGSDELVDLREFEDGIAILAAIISNAF